MNNPPKAAVVYFSQHGMTGLVASHIAEGAASAGCDVELCRIAPDTIVEGRYHNAALFDTLNQCDAIIFGSPTYMGSPSAQFKAFMDASGDCYVTKRGKISWREVLPPEAVSMASSNKRCSHSSLWPVSMACSGPDWIRRSLPTRRVSTERDPVWGWWRARMNRATYTRTI